MSGASLFQFRDLDLMLAVADSRDGVTAMELAQAIGLGEEGARAAAIRLTWMRRFGMLTYDEQHRIWMLSEGGARVVAAKLKGAAAKTIDSLPEEEMIEVMAHVTTRWRHGDPTMAHLIRREFLYGTQKR